MTRVAEFAPAVPPAARPAILSLLEGGEEPLKASERGEVRRVVSPALPRPVVVKRYPPRGLLRAASNRWKGSPARREFRASHRLAAEGVAVVEVLAFVESRAGPFLGDSFAVLEDLGDARSLLDALHASDPPTRRSHLEAAGRLAADLHAAGFLHGDLHAGNIFVRPGGSLALSDLARARARRGALRSRAGDLAFLLHSLRGFGTYERARCLRAYAARSGIPFRRLAGAAAAAIVRRGLHRALGATRHALETGNGRTTSLPDGWKGIAYESRAEQLRHALRAAPESRSTWSKIGAALWIRRLEPDEGERAWRELHRCGALGLPVAEPVAWFGRGAPADSFLAVLAPAGVSPLSAALLSRRGRARGACLRSLGRLARRAHDAGMRFGSVRAEGLLAAQDGGLLVAGPSGLEARRTRSIAARRADLEAFAAALPVRLTAVDRARIAQAYDPFGHIFPRGRGTRPA